MMPKCTQEKASDIIFKEIFLDGPAYYLQIPSVAIVIPLPLDLDFKIKYKGIKKTKEERLPLPLNYIAREGEIVEGFEAGETTLFLKN